jgi:hypothetical protein
LIGQLHAKSLYLQVLNTEQYKAYDNMYQAEAASAMQTKEDVAMQVINYAKFIQSAKDR